MTVTDFDSTAKQLVVLDDRIFLVVSYSASDDDSGLSPAYGTPYSRVSTVYSKASTVYESPCSQQERTNLDTESVTDSYASRDIDTNVKEPSEYTETTGFRTFTAESYPMMPYHRLVYTCRSPFLLEGNPDYDRYESSVERNTGPANMVPESRI